MVQDTVKRILSMNIQPVSVIETGFLFNPITTIINREILKMNVIETSFSKVNIAVYLFHHKTQKFHILIAIKEIF